MRLVVDTDVLIGMLFRAEGQRLLEQPALELFTAEAVWAEVRHELPHRAARFAARRGIEPMALMALIERALAIAEAAVLILPAEAYASQEEDARRRCDRDPTDWPTVATALLVDGGIWTEGRDFFGCGLPTWRSAILGAVLG
jgi:predicted nucleic acid-binding protein